MGYNHLTKNQMFRRIDIHAHIQASDFDADREAVAKRALDGGTAIINIGTDLVSSRAAVALADEHPEGVYAIVGLHPTDSDERFDAASYRALLAHQKAVGIGECGLDYFRMDADSSARSGAISRQKELFQAQIALANELAKPLMLHIRDAYDDAADMLRAHAKVCGNAHFFAGTVAQAKKFLDLGYTMSFTGVITFAREYAEVIEYVPLDMIQAETDCPFVAPLPHRGERNEPAYVSLVIDKIARIKKLPVQEVEKALLDNARRVWGLNI